MVEEPEALAAEVRECPFCAEVIKAAAVKCKHCGTDLVHSELTVWRYCLPAIALYALAGLIFLEFAYSWGLPLLNSAWIDWPVVPFHGHLPQLLYVLAPALLIALAFGIVVTADDRRRVRERGEPQPRSRRG